MTVVYARKRPHKGEHIGVSLIPRHTSCLWIWWDLGHDTDGKSCRYMGAYTLPRGGKEEVWGEEIDGLPPGVGRSFNGYKPCGDGKGSMRMRSLTEPPGKEDHPGGA